MNLKQSFTGTLVAAVAVVALPSAGAVIADFSGSTADLGSPTNAANLNAGSTGASWSGIGFTGTGGTIDVISTGGLTGNNLFMGPGGNATQTSTATITLDSAVAIAGTSFSFDAEQYGFGGQPGQFYIDLFDGGTQILRISLSPDSGGGRGTVNHWSAVGGTRTALSAEDQVFVQGTDVVANVSIDLGAANYGVTTTGGGNLDIAATGLAYFAGFSSTTFDSITITSENNKTNFAVDNLDVTPIPEPGSLALLGLGGLMMIRRRRA